MYVDAENLFSENQLVAVGASQSSSSVDLKRAGEDIGNGNPIYLVAVLVDDGAGTYTAPDGQIDFEFVSDDNSGLASPSVHALLGSFGAAATEGTTLCAALPATVGSAQEVEQYIGVQYQNAGTTTPNVTCFLTTTPQKYKQYPKSYTISG